MFFARYESSRLGRQVIDSEHLLLGVLREGDPVTAEIWRGFKLAPETIRARYPTAESEISSSAALPLSDDAKVVLAYALDEAQARDDVEVSPSHLLLAILRIPKCQAAVLLAEYGIDYDVVSEVFRIFKQHAQQQAELEDRTPLVLRQSHYEMLDKIAATMGLRQTRHENRQLLTLAIMDAFAATDVPDQRFETAEDLKIQQQAALTTRWPGA